jgi:parallel beta helix pectate lyase-like protein
LSIRRTVLAFAVLLAALSLPEAASAKGVACGATLTADTVLRADVHGCGGTALVIGADGVTLDLDGHSVDGAILASGHAHVAIRDGYVAGDVRLERVIDANVRHLRVRRGSIQCLRTTGCTIVGSLVSRGGIAIAESTSGFANRVRGNVVRHAPGAGIAADRTDTTAITDNVVRDSAIGIETSHAADIRISHNLIVRSSGDGLSGSFGSAAAILRNVILSSAGDGISLRIWGGETLIARNLVLHNGGNGILGAAVSHWRVMRNVASRNGATGITITGAVEDAILTRNRARRNRGLGIDAAPGVGDGGGNKARGNGAGAQCAGIACGQTSG